MSGIVKVLVQLPQELIKDAGTGKSGRSGIKFVENPEGLEKLLDT